MGQYLLVESRDPFDSVDVEHTYDLGARLAEERHDVAVFLVQNAVLATRRSSAAASKVEELSRQVAVYADDFSLRERGIGDADLAPGVRQATIDDLVDMVAAGRKVIWH